MFSGLSIGLYGVYNVRGVCWKKKASKILPGKPMIMLQLSCISTYIKANMQERVGIPNGYLDFFLVEDYWAYKKLFDLPSKFQGTFNLEMLYKLLSWYFNFTYYLHFFGLTSKTSNIWYSWQKNVYKVNTYIYTSSFFYQVQLGHTLPCTPQSHQHAHTCLSIHTHTKKRLEDIVSSSRETHKILYIIHFTF